MYGRSLFLAGAMALRGIGMGAIAASLPMMAAQRQASQPRRQRAPRAVQYRIPDLNRAKRHPTVHSYSEAALISERLGLRTRPLR